MEILTGLAKIPSLLDLDRDDAIKDHESACKLSTDALAIDECPPSTNLRRREQCSAQTG